MEDQESDQNQMPPPSPDAPGAEAQEEIVAALRAEVAKMEQSVKDSHNRYLRTMADFENYKKRTQREKIEHAQYANEKLIKEVLPVMDNIERAVSHSKEKRDFDKIVEGLELIQKQLMAALGKFGVTPIESMNKPFDPSLHQSIGQVESEEGSPEGEDRVIAETQKGYFLNDRVIRPSLVMVSKKNSAAP